MVRSTNSLKVQKYQHRTLKEVRKLSKAVPLGKKHPSKIKLLLRNRKNLIFLLLLSLILLLGTVKFLIKRKQSQVLLSASEAEPEPAKKKAQFVLFKPGKNIEDAAIEAKIDIERERSEIEADKAKNHAKEDMENEELRKSQTIQLMVGLQIVKIIWY